MLVDRIIGAFTFRREVYTEVEHDTSFTQTAWILVAVVALLNQIGTFAGNMSGGGGLVSWLIGSVVGTIFAVGGFALAAFIIDAVGRALFQAEVTFDEVVRTLGLAYVWNVVGVIGIVAAISPGLCIGAPRLYRSPLGIGFLVDRRKGGAGPGLGSDYHHRRHRGGGAVRDHAHRRARPGPVRRGYRWCVGSILRPIDRADALMSQRAARASGPFVSPVRLCYNWSFPVALNFCDVNN